MRNIRLLNSSLHGTAVFALLIATGCLLILPGCRSPLRPQHLMENGTGTLSLSIGEHGVGRTIMPETVLGDFV